MAGLRVAATVALAVLVSGAWAGCFGGDAEPGTGAADGGGPALVEGDATGNLSLDPVTTKDVRLAALPLGAGLVERRYDRGLLPDLPPLLRSQSTLFTLDVSDLWPLSGLAYQLWLVDEAENASVRSPLFTVSAAGARDDFTFRYQGAHLRSHSAVYVTIEPHRADDRRNPSGDGVMGLPVLRATFEDEDDVDAALEPARLFNEVSAAGTAEAGRGRLTMAFAVLDLPMVKGAEYHVWLELPDNASEDLGRIEQDENETGAGSFAAARILDVPGSAFLDVAKFAVTLELRGKEDGTPSGAVLMRILLR